MVEYRGETYQTGNATPNDARKVLKALVKAGAVNGSISKGANYRGIDILCGELKKRKVYFVTFTELGIINADVIMRAKDGDPMFFTRYRLSKLGTTMKNIYHTHQTSNGMNYSYWDEDYYLCDTEEEYANERIRYEERLASCKEDYKKRGVENFTPTLSKEHAIKAREYFYGHEWVGRNFDAVGFTWTERDSIGSRTEHILKPGSIGNQSNADNSECVGWMYGS